MKSGAMYPTLDRNTLLCQRRSDAALNAALDAGYTHEGAWKVADRARSEARAGITEGTSSFAGKVLLSNDGAQVVYVRTYTGHVIDPLQGGLENASTLD
jgi:hypothetical protein